MQKNCFLIFSVFILMKGAVHGQTYETVNQKKLSLKVITGNRTYKGILYYVSDSSIRVTRGSNKNDLPTRIAVSDIQQIIFKRKHGLIRSILGGLVTGAIFGAWLPVKLYDLGILVSDKVLFYGLLAGGSLGLVIGALSVQPHKIIIPINKSQQLYELNKSRLKGLSVY